MINKYKNYYSLSIEDREYIYYLIYNKPSHIQIMIKNHKPELFKKISEYSKENIKFTEKIYKFINQIDKKVCKTCKKEQRFISIKKGYNEFCSTKCRNEYIEENKNIEIKKYKNLNEEEKEKLKEIIKRYPSQLKQQIKKELNNIYISIERLYKDLNIIFFSEKLYLYINEKDNKITCSKEDCNNTVKFINFKKGYHKYCSVKCQASDIKTIEAKKSTCLKRYGKETNLKTEDTKNKSKKTCLKKYGTEYVSQSKSFKEKLRQKYKKKYGIDNYSQNKIKNYKRYNKEFFQKYFVINNEIDFEWVMKYYNIKETTIYRFLKRNDIKYIRKKNNNQKNQKEILKYIEKILIKNKIEYKIYFNTQKIISKDKRSLELDIYIELFKDNEVYKKVAIEYNGLMFHSFGVSKYSKFNNASIESEKKKYHLIKTEECEKQNIQLLHINENEWIDSLKKEIWKSMISSKLGVIEKIIYARKTYIKELHKNKQDKETVRLFLEKNHIQGKTNFKVALGLFDIETDNLVSVMTFGKPRFNKKYEYELLRFCSILNTVVIGSGSKLLKYFKKKYNPKSLISYGNRRWTYKNENFYIKNNFKFKGESPINFNYFHIKDTQLLLNRITLQKWKLKKYKEENKYKIKTFDKTKTNDENLYENGYRKIYDSGQLIYEN